MRKKIMISLAVLMFAVAFMGKSALATGPFDAIYMVDSEYSTVQKDIFGFYDPSPWVYLKIPEPQAYNLSLSFYTSPTNDNYWTIEFNSPGNEIWISLDDGYSGLGAIDWVDIVETGQWSVTAKYAGCGSGCSFYYGTTQFTVVPEPISSALFIVGAASLGAGRFRKKRKTA